MVGGLPHLRGQSQHQNAPLDAFGGAGFVEHCDHGRAPALLLAERGDVLTERPKVIGGLRGVSRALEDAYGGRVGPAVGLLENLVSHSLIDGNRVGRAGGLAALGEPEPQVAAKLLLFGGLSRLPRKLCLTVTQERLDDARGSRSRRTARAASRSMAHASTVSAARRRRL